MTALSIQAPFPIITDIDGQPLEDGFIWIGVANLPPIGNPITVYWDAALTQPAALPVRTLGGYPMNSGTPGRLYVNSDYSILVQNKNGSTVYSAPAATERLSDVVIDGITISSADVTFLQAGTGAVVRSGQSKMRDVVSVKDFGAVGDGVANDGAAIQLAINASAGKALFFPSGSYNCGSTGLVVTTSQEWFADGEVIVSWSSTPAAQICVDVRGPDLVETATALNSITQGATQITFAADPGALTDLILIRDLTNGSFNPWLNDYRAGEIVEKKTQAGATVTLVENTFGGYTASANLKAYTFSPINFKVTGIDFQFPDAVSIGMWLRRVSNWIISKCSFAGATNAAFRAGEGAYKGNISECRSLQRVTGGTGYAYSLTGAQEVIVSSCYGKATRHALQNGGDFIPNRRIVVANGVFLFSDPGNDQAGVDCHGNSEWVTFDGNETAGALLAGDNIQFINNQVTGLGYGVILRQMLGSNFNISNNTFSLFNDNLNGNRAVGIGFAAVAGGQRPLRGGDLIIANNVIDQNLSPTNNPTIYLTYSPTLFTQGANTRIAIKNNSLVSLAQISPAAQGVFVEAIGATVTVDGNFVTNAGVDVRTAKNVFVTNNVLSGGPLWGVFIFQVGIGALDQTVKICDNTISTFNYAGIEVQGDSTNKINRLVIEDNIFENISIVLQGSSVQRSAIYCVNTTNVFVNRNKNLTAGANQTNGYALSASVVTSYVFQNKFAVSPVENYSGTFYGDQVYTYTPTNVTPTRSIDANTINLADLADVVGTLIQDLQKARQIL